MKDFFMGKIEKCEVKECDRASNSKKHKLCTSHLYQYYRNGFVNKGKIREYKEHKSFDKEQI